MLVKDKTEVGGTVMLITASDANEGDDYVLASGTGSGSPTSDTPCAWSRACAF